MNAANAVPNRSFRPTVAKSAREILDDLREEINKSLEEQYGHEAIR